MFLEHVIREVTQAGGWGGAGGSGDLTATGPAVLANELRLEGLRHGYLLAHAAARGKRPRPGRAGLRRLLEVPAPQHLL